MSEQARLLIVHASEDAQLLQALENHLRPLVREGLIQSWHTGLLPAGANENERFAEEVAQADVVLLLLSAYFMASDQCQALLAQVQKQEALRPITLVPVLARPVGWRSTDLGDRTPLPRSGQAVTEWPNPDAAWLDVTEGLRTLLSSERGPAPTSGRAPNQSEAAVDRHDTVLLVDDDQFLLAPYREELEDRGIEVLTALNARNAMEMLQHQAHRIGAVVLDVMMPSGGAFDDITTHGGFLSGIALGRWLRNRHPQVQLLGFSSSQREDVKRWFESNGVHCLEKSSCMPGQFADWIEKLLPVRVRKRRPKVLIIYASEPAKDWLTDFLCNDLKLGVSGVLPQGVAFRQALGGGFGRGILGADVILLLPEGDPLWVAAPAEPAATSALGFEVGYVLGRLGNRCTRILLLCRPPDPALSGVSGMICVDLDQGRVESEDQLRRAFAPWLHEGV